MIRSSQDFLYLLVTCKLISEGCEPNLIDIWKAYSKLYSSEDLLEEDFDMFIDRVGCSENWLDHLIETAIYRNALEADALERRDC